MRIVRVLAILCALLAATTAARADSAPLPSALDLLPVKDTPYTANIYLGDFVGYSGLPKYPLGLPSNGGLSIRSEGILPGVTCLFDDPNYPKHTGLDIGMETASPVLSTMDGLVVFSGWSDTLGWAIAVENNGVQTWYGHNIISLVSAGDLITARQMIALAGSTGRSSGPHIHYGIYELSRGWVDPITTVAADRYRKTGCDASPVP